MPREANLLNYQIKGPDLYQVFEVIKSSKEIERKQLLAELTPPGGRPRSVDESRMFLEVLNLIGSGSSPGSYTVKALLPTVEKINPEIMFKLNLLYAIGASKNRGALAIKKILETLSSEKKIEPKIVERILQEHETTASREKLQTIRSLLNYLHVIDVWRFYEDEQEELVYLWVFNPSELITSLLSYFKFRKEEGNIPINIHKVIEHLSKFLTVIKEREGKGVMIESIGSCLLELERKEKISLEFVKEGPSPVFIFKDNKLVEVNQIRWQNENSSLY